MDSQPERKLSTGCEESEGTGDCRKRLFFRKGLASHHNLRPESQPSPNITLITRGFRESGRSNAKGGETKSHVAFATTAVWLVWGNPDCALTAVTATTAKTRTYGYFVPQGAGASNWTA